MRRISMLMTALLLVSFANSQTKTEIKTSDLSKGLSNYITKNFSGYDIDKAFKIDSKGVISTQVMISKGTDKLALTFDRDLKLIKKESISPDRKTNNIKDEKKTTGPTKK